MHYQNPKNPSAEKYANWQVRPVVGLAAHVAIGGTAQVFEFRPKDEHVAFNFVFVGYGLGVGPMLGAGSASFPEPHEFVGQTAKLIGQAFYEAGRQFMGGEPRTLPPPKYTETMNAFSDIEVQSPFSAIDLHRSFGRLTSASASLSMGYGACFITAFSLDRTFFESQSTGGDEIITGTTGVSLGANTNAGMWLMTT